MTAFSQDAGDLRVHLVEAGSDNYIAVPEWGDGCVVIDPGDASPVLEFLDACGVAPSAIWITHDHGDHVAGIPGVVHRFGCPVIVPRGASVPGADREVGPGDRLEAGPLSVEAIDTPGHCPVHLAFYDASRGLLWSGDCLFSGGCGRVFTGNPAMMWASLQRLAALPDETRFFCGHEYTESNLRFGLSVDPESDAMRKKLETVRRLRSDGQPTLPGTLEEERNINVFLRAGEPGIAAAVGKAGAAPVDVFGELRSRKDRF